jgi:hypothetical protein
LRMGARAGRHRGTGGRGREYVAAADGIRRHEPLPHAAAPLVLTLARSVAVSAKRVRRPHPG